MNKYYNLILILISSYILYFFLSSPANVMESVSFSMDIWLNNLFPSLFPFLLLSYFFKSYGISYILSEIFYMIFGRFLYIKKRCCYTVVASMFSGFPSSSKFIHEHLELGEISISEAEHLLSFCHFSSPLFILGTIGSKLLCNYRIGLFILISHYLGAFITSYFFKCKDNKFEEINFRDAFLKMQNIQKDKSFTNILKSSILDSLNTMFLLLGIVTFFLIVSNIFESIFTFNKNYINIFKGLIEMTQGIKYVSLSSYKIKKQAFLMLAFISFGGFSIHTQVFSILDKYKISYYKYFISRCLHVFFSCSILYFLFIIC